MTEVWKDILGYEGLYQVSSLGRVRSLDRIVKCGRGSGKRVIHGQLIKPMIDRGGYQCVNLYLNQHLKVMKVHRLVASVFIPNPNNLPQVNHKNEIKTDNKVSNLEWCDVSYNINYGKRNEKVAIHFSKEVLQFQLDGVYVASFPSAASIHRGLGFDASKICDCCNRKRKTAYGYIWRYA